MRKLDSLQYLRAIAATAVVVFHACNRVGMAFPIGEAGVDLFFVLSGFLMVAITSPSKRPAEFIRDRVTRIVPIYWIATTVFLIGGLLGAFPSLTLQGRHVLLSYLFVATPSPDSARMWPLLVPGWTLNYEMFFYAIFAAALWLDPRHRLRAVATVFVLLVLAGIAIGGGTGAASFYTDPILLEFLGGALLAAGWKRYGSPGIAAGYGLIAGAALLYVVVVRVAPGTDLRCIVFGIPALALLAGAVALEHRRGSLPGVAPLLLIGDASYSIYIWHTLILPVAVKSGAVLHLPAPAVVVAGTLASVVGGIVAYWAIELPLQRHFRRGGRGVAPVQGDAAVGRAIPATSD